MKKLKTNEWLHDLENNRWLKIIEVNDEWGFVGFLVYGDKRNYGLMDKDYAEGKLNEGSLSLE